MAGGELKSGGLQYFWGFGVHAPSELVFPLPDSAQAFRSGFGLDSSVGDFGSVVAKISIGDSAAAPLFQSKPLAGSRSAISTGDLVLGHHVPMVGDKPGARNLLLTVEDGGNAQGPVALAIGDHADWLEPTLVLDPVQLRADVQKFRPGAK